MHTLPEPNIISLSTPSHKPRAQLSRQLNYNWYIHRGCWVCLGCLGKCHPWPTIPHQSLRCCLQRTPTLVTPQSRGTTSAATRYLRENAGQSAYQDVLKQAKVAKVAEVAEVAAVNRGNTTIVQNARQSGYQTSRNYRVTSTVHIHAYKLHRQ